MSQEELEIQRILLFVYKLEEVFEEEYDIV